MEELICLEYQCELNIVLVMDLNSSFKQITLRLFTTVPVRQFNVRVCVCVCARALL